MRNDWDLRGPDRVAGRWTRPTGGCWPTRRARRGWGSRCLLKFLELEGRFPADADEVPAAVDRTTWPGR